MWPKGNIVLQLLVVFCLVLLAAERAINVFVPIYYKNIGEYLFFRAVVLIYYLFLLFICRIVLIRLYVFVLPLVDDLTGGRSWHTVATTVCIYVLLKFLQGGGAGTTYSFIICHLFSASNPVSRDHSGENGQSTSPFPLPPPRCLGVCQQHALVPVDPRAAVHQPRGSGASVRPLALALPALASGPQNRGRAEEHGPRHLLHQQPAQVRWCRLGWKCYDHLYV